MDAKGLVSQHFENAASFWKRIYDNNDVYGTIHQQRRDAVLSLVNRLGLPYGSCALDIGCGAGSISVALARQGYRMCAIDPAVNMIRLTEQAAREANVDKQIHASVGDIHSLPFPDGSFDLVLAIGVLPWLADEQTPYREIARVLRVGGYFVGNIDNRFGFHRMLDPGTNFLLAPLRTGAVTLLEKMRLKTRKVRVPTTTVSPRHFQIRLQAQNLQTIEGTCFGFGPFSVFGRTLFSPPTGIQIHHRLQRWSDHGVPLLKSMGAQYLVGAQKQNAQ